MPVIEYSDNSFEYYERRQKELDELRRQSIPTNPRRRESLGKQATSELTEQLETSKVMQPTTTPTPDVDTGFSRIMQYGEEGFGSLDRL